MKDRLCRNTTTFAVFSFLLGIANCWTFVVPSQLFLRRIPPPANSITGSVTSKHNLLSVSNHEDSSIGASHHASDEENQMVLDYITCVGSSIECEQFVAFTLHGPTKDAFNEVSEARGYLRMIKGRPIILTNKLVVQATFKYHGTTDVCKNWNVEDCRNNLEAILLSKTAPAIVPSSEWGALPPTTFGQPRGIRSATIEMSNGTKLELKVNRGKATLKRYQTNKANQRSSEEELKHDRNKYTFVDLSSPVWLALGVAAPSTGAVKPGMSSKLRQCQKFVEIVDRLVGDYIGTNEDHTTPNIDVVDMGCGRGYLTFALHSYLHGHYRAVVTSRGIDIRPKLVKEISEIASGLGTEFERIQFEVGTIESFLTESPPDRKESSSVEVVIALHACDTASDDALWSGICRNSDIIVVAPCCHRELRPQLNVHVSGGDEKSEHPYMDILRHNIFRERIAETITDSMRALLLELTGYTVQVFEFIGGEHTSKNVMITAVKNKKMLSLKETATDAFYWNRLERLQSLAKLHGIKKHKLATWIGVALSESDIYQSINDTVYSRSRPTRMPPLQR